MRKILTGKCGLSVKGTAWIEVVYTRTDETADAYIERLVHDLREKYRITVATNDGLEQLTVMGQGALRLSLEGLREEILQASEGFCLYCTTDVLQ